MQIAILDKIACSAPQVPGPVIIRCLTSSIFYPVYIMWNEGFLYFSFIALFGSKVSELQLWTKCFWPALLEPSLIPQSQRDSFTSVGWDEVQRKTFTTNFLEWDAVYSPQLV